MAYLVGSFLGTMLIPCVLLLIAGRMPKLAWLRFVAIACPILAMYGSGRNADAGEALALIITAAWAGYQAFRSRKGASAL